MANPLNIKLMNVNEFIQKNHCKPVSTILIKETSSTVFHHAGLFSEDIFGQIGSPDRLIKFGYIDLRTQIFHPTIYTAICKLKALYGEIMARKTYAKFDDEIKDFVRSDESDEFADTGYKFFMDHFNEIKFVKNSSLTQNEKVDLIEKYRNNLIISRCLVMPAGLRDMDVEDGKPETGSINKLYGSLINYSLAMPTTGSVSDIYDGIRFSIQKKVCEIYDYLFDMIGGKFGFFQRKYGSRNLALGTRNVISTASMAASSPDDPQYLAMDEIKIPLFQGAKMMMPIVIYWMKTLFFNDIFSLNADNVALIDPNTLNLVYQPITEDEKAKFLSSEGIEKITNLFRDEEFRFTPCIVYNEKEQPFYAFMVYDDETTVYFTRSVSELQRQFKEHGVIFNRNKLRPITYAEMMYIATWLASRGRHATLTRYPAMEISSDVPCRIHLISTNPGRKIKFIIGNDLTKAYDVPEYPIINTSFTDSTILHPQVLAGLGADFDGNCVVGSTTTKIRFTNSWLDTIKQSDYSVSNQNVENVVSTIVNKIYHTDNEWNYAEVRMDEFPQPGTFTLDRHGAKVYEIPDGCYVESFDSTSTTIVFEPIKHITVEDRCDTAKIILRSKSVQVSINESVAVFDRSSGGIKRIKPLECSNNTYIPVVVKSNQPFGTYGTADAGFKYGVSIHDSISNDVLLNGSEEFMWGVLSGVIDRTGSYLINKHTELGFKVYLSISSSTMCESVKHLCYRLGVRINKIIEKTSGSFIVVLSSVDICKYADKLVFTSSKYNCINQYVKDFMNTPKRDKRDVIPITYEEGKILRSVSDLPSKDTAYYTPAVMRSVVMNLIDKLDPESALVKRALNTNIHWEPVRSVIDCPAEAVYDFDVPTTKLYIVNDGVVTYDTVSVNAVLSNEANAEVRSHLNSVQRYVHANGSLYLGLTDLVALTLYNLSRSPA